MQPCELLSALRARRLVAIVRGRDPGAAIEVVVSLVRQGIDLVEVSLTGAGALRVIEAATRELGPGARLGAGTVLSVADVGRAVDAGARFVVTPALTDAVGECAARGIPVLAGSLSPTEVASAVSAGATGVKLFPAGANGPGYLRALRDPFPGVAFVPVGGVDVDAARDYLAAGALAVGVGGPLVGDAADGGDLASMRARAERFRAVSEEAACPTS